MIKLRDILKEIGETTKPYPFTTTYSGVRGGSARREYTFVNSNYDTIEVQILVDIHGEERINGTLHEGPEFTVLFSSLGAAHSEEEDEKYREMTGSGDALRVLSTVVACVKDAADKLYGSLDEILTITFKGDDKRFNIYLKYAQKQLPTGWIIKTAEGDDTITLINTNIE
jgi:hypothetical protein